MSDKQNRHAHYGLWVWIIEKSVSSSEAKVRTKLITPYRIEWIIGNKEKQLHICQMLTETGNEWGFETISSLHWMQWQQSISMQDATTSLFQTSQSSTQMLRWLSEFSQVSLEKSTRTWKRISGKPQLPNRLGYFQPLFTFNLNQCPLCLFSLTLIVNHYQAKHFCQVVLVK